MESTTPVPRSGRRTLFAPFADTVVKAVLLAVPALAFVSACSSTPGADAKPARIDAAQSANLSACIRYGQVRERANLENFSADTTAALFAYKVTLTATADRLSTVIGGATGDVRQAGLDTVAALRDAMGRADALPVGKRADVDADRAAIYLASTRLADACAVVDPTGQFDALVAAP